MSTIKIDSDNDNFLDSELAAQHEPLFPIVEEEEDVLLDDAEGDSEAATDAVSAETSPEVLELRNMILEQNKTINTLLTKQQTQDAAPVQPAAPTFDEATPEELDNMTSGQLVEYMSAKSKFETASLLDEKLSPVQGNVETLSQKQTNALLKIEVRDASAKYPDLNQWKDEILTIKQDNPTLTIEQSLLLAKGQNPTKAATIHQRMAITKKAQRAYGGSGTGASGQASPGKNAGKQDFASAFNNAWSAEKTLQNNTLH